MYKNLSAGQWGVFGRHTDLIELALTYKFQGIDLALDEVLRRAESLGAERACVYLVSSGLQIGGWELPFSLDGSQAAFDDHLAWLEAALEVAQACAATRCLCTVPVASDYGPFPEVFDLLAQRLTQLGELLGPRQMQLAVGLRPCAPERRQGGYSCITQTQQLVQLLAQVRLPQVGLLFDSWNWTVGGGDLPLLQRAGVPVHAVRLSALPEPAPAADDLREEHRLPPDPAGGAIDQTGYLQALHQVGYCGPVALAAHPLHFKGQSREAAVRSASAALDALLAAAGAVPCAGSLQTA